MNTFAVFGYGKIVMHLFVKMPE